MSTFIVERKLIEIFIDTSYALALSNKTDSNHKKALELSKKYDSEQYRFVTTYAILLEIGNGLAKLPKRPICIELLEYLQEDDYIPLIDVTKDLYDESFRLFSERRDKEWGLVDCTSMIVMKRRSIHQVFTADQHFEQAGFQALMRQ